LSEEKGGRLMAIGVGREEEAQGSEHRAQRKNEI